MATHFRHADRPTRIGVDARALEAERTGIGRYLENLFREWTRCGPPRRFILYVLGQGPTEEWMRQPPFTLRRLSFEAPGQGDLFEAELARDPPDVFFAPLYDLPRPMPVSAVVTVHDMIHEARPEGFNAIQIQYLRNRHAWACSHARRIITDSHFARRDIIAHHPQAEQRLVVIPLAADPRFTPALPGVPEEAPRDSGLPSPTRPFALYVGAITEKRHVPALVEAFAGSQVLRERGWSLVIVGRNYLTRPAPLDSLLQDSGPRVIHHAHVSNEDLLRWYRQAGMFVYPSTYEGFGMPPLEAMACGTPVISVPFASLPEVLGDAARMVSCPWHPEAMREALEEVALDVPLRARMIEAGRRQAALFSWSETARRTLCVLDEAARGIEPGE